MRGHMFVTCDLTGPFPRLAQLRVPHVNKFTQRFKRYLFPKWSVGKAARNDVGRERFFFLFPPCVSKRSRCHQRHCCIASIATANSLTSSCQLSLYIQNGAVFDSEIVRPVLNCLGMGLSHISELSKM